MNIDHELLDSENRVSGKPAKTACVDEKMKRPKQIVDTTAASERVSVDLGTADAIGGPTIDMRGGLCVIPSIEGPGGASMSALAVPERKRVQREHTRNEDAQGCNGQGSPKWRSDS